MLPKKPHKPGALTAPLPVPLIPVPEVVDEGGFDEDVSATDPDRPPSVDELKARRKPLSPQDRRVTDDALGWMASLPSERRLMYTMLDYPHVVNALARCWSDKTSLTMYFDDLLHSRRRYRAGFASAAQAELVALSKWAREHDLVI